MTETFSLATREATLAYDIRGQFPPGSRPPVMMVGAPMDVSGFAALAAQFPDRTVATYAPRGVGRGARHDGRTAHTPQHNARDIRGNIEALDRGPVDLFAGSGGAVSVLALVSAHPEDVSTLVAHEPPLLATLPDAEYAFACERVVQHIYRKHGWGHGMAAFLTPNLFPVNSPTSVSNSSFRNLPVSAFPAGMIVRATIRCCRARPTR